MMPIASQPLAVVSGPRSPSIMLTKKLALGSGLSPLQMHTPLLQICPGSVHGSLSLQGAPFAGREI